jgi:hypothetical protein
MVSPLPRQKMGLFMVPLVHPEKAGEYHALLESAFRNIPSINVETQRLRRDDMITVAEGGAGFFSFRSPPVHNLYSDGSIVD